MSGLIENSTDENLQDHASAAATSGDGGNGAGGRGAALLGYFDWLFEFDFGNDLKRVLFREKISISEADGAYSFTVDGAALQAFIEVLDASAGRELRETIFDGDLDFAETDNHEITFRPDGEVMELSIDGALVTTFFRGSDDDDALDGVAGNDVLFGGEGMDNLNGGAGNDILYGAGDNDSLDGGAGDDRLDGGGGTNEHVGGDGSDTFVIDADRTEGFDDVMDFDVERGDLGGVDARAAGRGRRHPDPFRRPGAGRCLPGCIVRR